jgi:hypothetical protein
MTAAEIAETLSMPLSTVSAVLTRQGIGRLGRIALEPVMRYERSRPGELVHIDIKKLGRIAGGAGKRVDGRTATAGRPRRRDAAGRDRGTIGWNSSTSPSTTTAAPPMPKCYPTRKRPQRAASSSARLLSLPDTGSTSSAC